MDKIIKIHTLEYDIPKEMILMVVDMVDKGNSSTGKPYVTVNLFDGVKTIGVNFFDDTVETLKQKGITNETILKITIKKIHGKDNKGTFYNKYNDNYEINTDSSITKRDFVHAAPIDPDRTFEWLLSHIRELKSDEDAVGPYKRLTDLTLKLLEDNKEAFMRSSAAVTMHHNYLSGLLHHTARMVAMAEKACKVYKMLDEELLVCATALHDIGKITCYETLDFGEANITVEGRLLDHSVVGITMIHDASKEGLYNPEKIQMLEHMIASHHGKKEWDAITTPAFPEAEMLHIIDLADSRMNMFEEAYKGQEPGTISNEKVFGLENSYIYKPMYME